MVADSRVWCGECPACQREAYNLCEHLGFVGEVFDGGFAQYVVLPLKNVLPVPDDVPDDIAVLSEPLGVALRVVNQLGVTEGAHVRVAGGGTIGGLAALLLHRLKHCLVHLQEPNAERYQLLSSLVPFEPAQPYAFAVEATGKEAVLSTLIENIASGGRIAMVGIFHQTAQLDVNALVEREITLVGCSVFQDEQRQALDLMASLASELRAIMAPPVPLEAVPDTYAQLVAGNSAWLKAVIMP
ncbi:zinc-binding dehydrogenase [Mangrovibacter sp. SLW1]